MLDVRSFRGGDFDIDHILVVAKVREGLTASKQEAQQFDGERSNLRKVNESEVRKQYPIEISYRFAAFENLNDSEDIKRFWKNIKRV